MNKNKMIERLARPDSPVLVLIPLISATLVLLVLTWFGLREQQLLSRAAADRAIGELGLDVAESRVDMQGRIRQMEQSVARYADHLGTELTRMDTADRVRQAVRFDRLYQRGGDGVWRNPRQSFDASRHAMLVVPPSVDLTSDLKAFFVRSAEITQAYGLGAAAAPFDSTYILPASNGAVLYWPSEPEYPFQAGPEYNYLETDWVRLVHPNQNPSGAVRWTRASYDPLIRKTLLSALAPIYWQGRWFGSAGHDTALSHLAQHFGVLERLPGSRWVLVQDDGLLLASGRYQQQIEQTRGRLRLQTLGDPSLQKAWNLERKQGMQTHLLGSDVVFVASVGPGWWLMNAVPIAPVLAPIHKSFERLRWLVMSAFGLEVLIASVLMWGVHRAHRRRWVVMRQARLELEQQVERRTAELAARNTELQQSIVLLNTTRDQLVQSEKMAGLGQLVAGVAHELNTPLGNARMVSSGRLNKAQEMLNSLEVGLKKTELRDFLQECVHADDLVERNLARAAELLGAFKQVAVDQSGEQRRHFDLAQVIHDTFETLGPRLSRAGVEVRFKLDQHIDMDSYPGAISQIVSNFVTNSLMHGFVDRDRGVIEVELQTLPGQVLMIYQDDGSGILPEHLPRVFEPFFTTRLGRGGSGLGMHIVYNMVSGLLGGVIQLSSQPGQGVRIRLVLPVCAPNP